MTGLPLAMIIEDNPQLRHIFAVALQQNFTTEVISDGQAALERLERATPQLIILDLNLPNVSGADILDYIRATPRLEGTRVILATADAQRAEMLSASADMVLLKPISPMQLRELAARLG